MRGSGDSMVLRDADAPAPEVRAPDPEVVAKPKRRQFSAPDLIAYFAAVAAHPAYTARFKSDLVRPQLRFPITGDASLFREAITIGRQVIWLHCFGERFSDPREGRPKRAPRLKSVDERPVIPRNGRIPTQPALFPNSIQYDPAACELHVGQGFVKNVPKQVWEYEVSGKQVLIQ